MVFKIFNKIGQSAIQENASQNIAANSVQTKKSDISVWLETPDSADAANNCSSNTKAPKEPYATTEGKPSVFQRLPMVTGYPDIPLDANGDIDFNELTIDKLKKIFPESDYTIECELSNDASQEEFILVTSKKDNKTVFSYQNITYPNGDNRKRIKIVNNEIETGLAYSNEKLDYLSIYHNREGDYTLITAESYDDNGGLITKETYDEDKGILIVQEYSNGILCNEKTSKKTGDSEFETVEEKRLLSDKLVQDIENRINALKSGIGFLPKTDNIEDSILNGISKNNVCVILIEYEEATGRSLIQDIITNEMGLEGEKQKELLLHVTTMMREGSLENSYFWNKSVGYELQFTLLYGNKEALKEVLDKVNKDNVDVVLEKMFNITEKDHFSNFTNSVYMLLSRKLDDDTEEYISKLRDAMIQNINERGGYTKDLVEDIEANKDGSKTRKITDFTRLINRCLTANISEVTGKPDGKIDINNIKQGQTGDCWLIAAILSATNKNQKGLDYINSLLSVDDKGNVTVELKGVHKKYVISAEEIEKSNHLSNCDPDMRALEIAVDRYMKEDSYGFEDIKDWNYNYSRADINGDWEDEAYTLLFGRGYSNSNPDILNDDYNNENKIYTISFNDREPNIKATVLGGSEKTEVDLIGRHAYAIKGSDEKYIYLINPHNSSETIQVERALLEKPNLTVCMTEIERPKTGIIIDFPE